MKDEYKTYEEYDFGDKRIGERLALVLTNKTKSPQLSIYASSEKRSEAKATYRLLSNSKLNISNLVEAIREDTVNQIKESNETVILVPQDTSDLNYSNLKTVTDLGFIGDSVEYKGILMHSAIAVTTLGVPLGILSLELWERSPESIGASKGRSKKTIEEKESYKWLKAGDEASKEQPDNVKYIYICDREGDIYPYFADSISKNRHLIVRSIRNRKVVTHGGTTEYLMDYMRATTKASAEKIAVRVPRDSHFGKEAREAIIQLSYEKVKLLKSRYTKDEVADSLDLYAVCAMEENAPEGVSPIEWHLLTTEPVENSKDAERILDWYAKRWKIELFHRVLKEGCKVEQLHESTAEKLEKAIAMYAIVAINLLKLTFLGRECPNLPCSILFSDTEWKILYRFANRTKALPNTVPTIGEAVMMMAKLGGFSGYKSDGNPGVKSLWMGYQKFSAALEFVLVTDS